MKVATPVKVNQSPSAISKPCHHPLSFLASNNDESPHALLLSVVDTYKHALFTYRVPPESGGQYALTPPPLDDISCSHTLTRVLNVRFSYSL
ncbi:hypothetical protein ACLOJK_007783 [Asimina triloba]